MPMRTEVDDTSGPGEANALLAAAWAALAGRTAAPGRVRVAGWHDGLLASSLPCLAAMTAAVACSTLAVSETDAARRGGGARDVTIDAAHVAVVARSERYAHRSGSAPADLFAPLSRFWRTCDGWLRTHANYSWHKQRALTVLGCDDDADSFAAAVARWRGDDLEEALAQAGALGFTVRSRGEWLAHPHGRAVAALPLLTSVPAAGRARALPAGGLLQDVRVLDMTRVIAGPVATRTLAGWGADVLRLDSPRLPEIDAQTIDTLPGKRSAELDVATADGRRELDRLLAQADVLVQGYRPGALARYGLAADDLTERHPHLSVVSLSAWGPAGPWSLRRGFDSLVQCATGIAAAEGDGPGSPGALPAQVLDHATGYLGAAAAALSLAGVARGHAPRHAELSLAQTAEWLQSLGGDRRAPATEADPEPYMTTLNGPDSAVHVVAPAGRVGWVRPRWQGTTRLRADPPSFDSPGRDGQRPRSRR